MKRLILFLILLLFFSSCSKPPDGINEISLIKLIYEKLLELDSIKDNYNDVKKYIKNFIENYDVLFSFKKGNSIIIKSNEASINKDTIIYSLKDNQFKLNKGLYVTMQNKRIVYSVDYKNWYSTKNDVKKNISSIKNDYDFYPVLYKSSVNILYKFNLSIGDNPEIVKLDGLRTVKILKKGMVFKNNDNQKVNLDLNKYILYIPKNSVIYGRINIIGNIVNGTTNYGEIKITSLNDFYMYFKDMKLALSFDKENWNISIFSFLIEPLFNVYAESDNKIYFDITANTFYNENETSFSILKLVVNFL